MVPSNHSFSNSAIEIVDFSQLPLVSLLILFSFFFVSVHCFVFEGSLSKVIAVPTIAIAIVVALSRSIFEAIQKRSHEPIYKTQTKIEAKRLKATIFAIAKLEER